ncbi:DUF4870 domain-containing protein [Bacillus sp. Marseille-Q3570]|uniref:DUF4870 domain-containing protein n=1 Tax=Bacillus sp. Marseille-Q3570 TaxID=2963522 RepID=UPI0021B78DAC|nr:DUF4870 domain-containing protein [Bacillus sp. Marseille-Q3570]
MDHNSELSKEERNWGMYVHLAAFAGYLTAALGFIIGPLLLWLLKKDEYAYVDYHGKEALNFQISFFIYGLVAGALMIILIGFALLPIVVILHLIFMIIGTIRASEGNYYRFPLTIRFIK